MILLVPSGEGKAGAEPGEVPLGAVLFGVNGERDVFAEQGFGADAELGSATVQKISRLPLFQSMKQVSCSASLRIVGVRYFAPLPLGVTRDIFRPHRPQHATAGHHSIGIRWRRGAHSLNHFAVVLKQSVLGG